MVARKKTRVTPVSKAEPTIDKANYNNSLSAAFHWYKWVGGWEDKRYFKVLTDYVKTNGMKSYIPFINKANIGEVRTVAIIAHLITRNEHIELNHVERLFCVLEELKERYNKVPDVTVTPETKKVPSIQDRILDLAKQHATSVDEKIDEFIKGGYRSEFSMSSYLKGNQISGPVAKRIGVTYKWLADEMDEVVQRSDDQLNEAYSHIGKREAKRYAEFLRKIVVACEQQEVSAKSQRKPRKIKVKSPAVIVAKLKYTKECLELGLTSANPTSIIGAMELWVYDPQRRKLGVYKALDQSGLGVNRTAITDYSVAESGVKTLRQPEAFFKGLKLGRLAINTGWKSIKGRTTPVKPRLSENMIILLVG